ncbi:sorting nexin mvp1 like protein [Zymoseptoria brevis]|uniref:Sorting nexin MVP1 n=1 Tax=Zymoseptoria brevis TaxID=1047168 RepID=A0A0F4GNJ6_9PEZI|nr:sorting nexin mvp1 like protein [Zymoseptoria brevis]
MSLFGDDDPPAAASTHRAKSSLFDDDSNTPGTPSKKTSLHARGVSNSIFASAEPPAAAAEDDSPWGFTPKKSKGSGNVIKTLLADAVVPDGYVDAFDELQVGGRVSVDDAQKLVKECGVGVGDRTEVWRIVSAGDQELVGLGRGEFFVLLALVGLALEGEELGLDAVDERRGRLPVVKMPVKKQANAEVRATEGGPPTSFGAGFGEADPWGSPEMHKGHGHVNGGAGGGAASQQQRTTSTFTTASMAESTSAAGGSYGNGQTNSSGGGSWGASAAYGASGTAGFGNGDAVEDDGFGTEGTGPSAPPRRPQQPRVATGKGVEEVITVNLLDEKEGMFLFQHRNYEVASIRRNSKVIRRYSDFVWLLDCLHKRYPFRQLPLLPPKRVSINGNHIATDSAFLEKRRRGLVRFANALVRHPVLREEQLVVMFLTVPTELAVWRKQATISVQEEFVGRALPPTLEDSLPPNLQETFDTVRSGVRRSADLYINLCTLVERLCKRKEALAAEYGRLNLNLVTLTEVTADTYAIDPSDVSALDAGLRGSARHVNTSQSLLEDEARAWDEGVLEDLKTMRDGLVSVREMFERKDRLAKDNIPQLEKRIAGNESKLAAVRAKGDGAKVGEADKVVAAITADKQSIVDQHARGVFIRECVRDELLHFQSSQYRVSRLQQEWAQERVKYAELQADNFRGLVDTVEAMPLGD